LSINTKYLAGTVRLSQLFPGSHSPSSHGWWSLHSIWLYIRSAYHTS